MKVYKELLEAILRDGETHQNRTGVDTLSTFGQMLRIDMRGGFPLLTLRKLPWRWIAEELFWMMSGSTNANELKSKQVFTWDAWATEEMCKKFSREQGDLGPTYGWLLRHFNGQYMPTWKQNVLDMIPDIPMNGWDQVADICRQLALEPYSRRLLLSMWDPTEVGQVEVPPCAPLVQLKVHNDEEMSMSVYMRSSDAFVGLAFDIAHFALMLEIFSWATIRRPRHLIFQIGDCHIYKTHMPLIEEMMGREPRPLPGLLIHKPLYAGRADHPGYAIFKNVMEFEFENLVLMDYNPHPKMFPAVAV